MYHYGAGTNVGNVRDNNEDSFVCDEDKHLWIVADGMGGLGFGEVASAITTYTVATLVREGHGINQAIELAHKNIKSYAESDGLGTNMGTTIVLLLSHGSLYNIFWVGDSRAYLLDGATMKQITVDHSLVQSLIDQGELTHEQAATDPRKNAVTRALGVQELETVRADSISERWKSGQKILLCSDGLTDCVTDENIEKLMREGGTDQQIVDRLIKAALDGGGKDNVTVIVVSAPATAKRADTDTHVPSGTSSDDTHVPPADKQESSGETKGKSPDASRAREKEKSSPGIFVRRQLLPAAIAALLLVTLIGPLTRQEPPNDISAGFRVSETSPVTEPIARQFPSVEFRAGQMVQLGLFSRLEGAEARTTALVELGLAPHVEKRVTVDGARYAVVLGPLDSDSHRQTIELLEAHNLAFFHTNSLRNCVNDCVTGT